MIRGSKLALKLQNYRVVIIGVRFKITTKSMQTYLGCYKLD